MKRIYIYILTAMALLNSSCSADWLDLNTTSSVETGQAIVTLDDAQIALNGIYRLASGHSYYGDNYWYYAVPPMYRHVSPKETENVYLPTTNTMCSLPII